jgi:hypothetical protein
MVNSSLEETGEIAGREGYEAAQGGDHGRGYAIFMSEGIRFLTRGSRT